MFNNKIFALGFHEEDKNKSELKAPENTIVLEENILGSIYFIYK